MWRLWISQSCFSLGFLSQYSLWKLSIFRRYKGYLYWSEKGMQRVIFFFITEWTGDLASRLDGVASPSRELTKRPDRTFFPVVLQLAWCFSLSACLARVQLLAACKLRATHEIQSRIPTTLHKLEHFFTFSHTLPLHDSYLNIGLLIAKIQINLTRNKTNKMVD